MTWIKLSTRETDPKVLRLADLTGERADRVYLAILRWFFWIDDNHKAGSLLSVTETHFSDITRWTGRKSLAEAMRHPDIGWLEQASDGRYVPSRLDSHFGSTTKSRALGTKRVQDHRQRNAVCNGPPLQSLISSDSESSGSGSEPNGENAQKPRARCAPVILTGDGHDSPLHRALAEWSAAAGVGWNAAAWGCVARWEAETLPVLGLPADQPDAIQRIVAALRKRGTSFRNVKYALACVGGAIEEWARSGVPPWEAVPQQGTARPERPEDKAARILADMAERSVKA